MCVWNKRKQNNKIFILYFHLFLCFYYYSYFWHFFSSFFRIALYVSVFHSLSSCSHKIMRNNENNFRFRLNKAKMKIIIELYTLSNTYFLNVIPPIYTFPYLLLMAMPRWRQKQYKVIVKERNKIIYLLLLHYSWWKNKLGYEWQKEKRRKMMKQWAAWRAVWRAEMNRI